MDDLKNQIDSILDEYQTKLTSPDSPPSPPTAPVSPEPVDLIKTLPPSPPVSTSTPPSTSQIDASLSPPPPPITPPPPFAPVPPPPDLVIPPPPPPPTITSSAFAADPPPPPPRAPSDFDGFNPPIPEPSSPLAKGFFFVSLFVFVGILSAFFYNLYLYLTPSSTGDKSNPAVPTLTPTPPPATSCQLNDQTYQVGQTFPAADGCNQCTCATDLTISCTEMDCSTPPSIPDLFSKINKSLESNIPTSSQTRQFGLGTEVTQKDAKVLDLSQYILDKEKIIQIKKVITDFGLSIDGTKSGEGGSNWVERYQNTQIICDFSSEGGKTMVMACFENR